MGVLTDLGSWLWRLLPGNPILVRVVTGGGKRLRHLYVRMIYLAILFVVLLVAGSGALSGAGSLAELAKKSSNAFMVVSMVQLLLTSFIAPIFTAGAITQEKDANTYHILLTTPLSNAQIVLGSLLSRLYFVWALLLSGLPIFCITMIYGGVTLTEVRDSLLLAAATGLVMGALAITISMTRIGTRRTIFSFFVGVATYMIGVWAIGVSPWGQLAAAPPGEIVLGGAPLRMSWLAPVHPFMALLVVTDQVPAPDPSAVASYGWPRSWMLAYPQYAYVVLTTLLSIFLILVSLAFVRRGEKEGEPTLTNRLAAVLGRREPTTERRRTPRSVWANPIAWREAATRGSAAGQSVMRWVFLLGGFAAGVVLLVASLLGWWGLNPDSVKPWVITLLWIEVGAILLVVTNTAASTLTREKESQTMEILLSTPLTSQYIISGMTRGLVSFVLPMVAVPTLTLLLFLLADLATGRMLGALGWLQATVSSPLLMIAYASIAAMIGLHWSLHSRKTVQASVVSTGCVLIASLILVGCGAALGGASPTVAAFLYPFAPFLSFIALVSPERLGSVATPVGLGDVPALRVTAIIATLAAILAYSGFTYGFYRSMVRNFDMTVRRQSA